MPTRSLGDILAANADLQPKPQYKVRSARSRNRAAAWRYDLEQWRQYRLVMAKSDRERGEIEDEHRARSYGHVRGDASVPARSAIDRGRRPLRTSL